MREVIPLSVSWDDIGGLVDAHERFLAGAHVDSDVRDPVLDSWKRCRSAGLEPHRLLVPFVPDLAMEDPFLRAADPVLTRLTASLAHVSMTVVLCDGQARMVQRHGGDRQLLTRLDEVNFGDFVKGLPAKASMVLKATMGLPYGTLKVRLPDGRRVLLGGKGPGPEAELVLNNWRRIDPAGPIALENTAALQHFLGIPDEHWFGLVHVEVEARAAGAMQGIQNAIQAAAAGDDHIKGPRLRRHDRDRRHASTPRRPDEAVLHAGEQRRADARHHRRRDGALAGA